MATTCGLIQSETAEKQVEYRYIELIGRKQERKLWFYRVSKSFLSFLLTYKRSGRGIATHFLKISTYFFTALFYLKRFIWMNTCVFQLLPFIDCYFLGMFNYAELIYNYAIDLLLIVEAATATKTVSSYCMYCTRIRNYYIQKKGCNANLFLRFFLHQNPLFLTWSDVDKQKLESIGYKDPEEGEKEMLIYFLHSFRS